MGNSSFNNRAYMVQNSGASHCLADILRFEVRPGDMAANPDTGERNEIGTTEKWLAGGHLRITFDMLIEPGTKDAVPNNWIVLGQLKGATNPSNPPMSLELTVSAAGIEEFRVVTRDASDAYRRLYRDPGEQRDQWRRYQIDVVPGLSGSLSVKRGTCAADPDAIVTLTDLFTPFTGALGQGDAAGYYWKSGIYRYPNQLTIATQVRNLRVEKV